MSLVEPCLEAEVQALLDYAVNTAPDSMYIRLVSVKWPVPFAYPHHHKVEPGRGWVVRDGSDAVVFAYGPWLLANAYEAADEVEQSTGATVRLVNLPWLNRVDPRWLREVIGGRRYILTLDNHYLKGGQGEMLATAIAELSLEPTPRILRVGVTSLPECGTNDEVLAHHKLDVASLVKSMRYVVPQIA
jgi:transketolase